MATAAKQAARQGGMATGFSGVKGWPERFRNYVDGLKREMRLVTWPSQKQVQATTMSAEEAFKFLISTANYIPPEIGAATRHPAT